MARSTTLVGLNPAAKELLKPRLAGTKEITVTLFDGTRLPTTTEPFYQALPSEDLGPVLGMFDETVHILRKYTLQSGQQIEEYIQAEPWSSGPVIFLALRDVQTKQPIEGCMWSDEEMYV